MGKFFRKYNKAGFTLIEVIISVVIFSILITSLYYTFRIGIKAYNNSHKSVESLQNVRFAVNLITKDIRGMFTINERDYNTNFKSIKSANPYLFEEDNEEEYHGALGIQIDLAFVGTNNGDKDKISFVTKKIPRDSEDTDNWGLERVQYYIDGEKRLVRSAEDITTSQLTSSGKKIEKETSAPDITAFDVESFDLKYVYYFDYAWRYSPDWNSNDKKYKNPPNPDEEKEANESDDQFAKANYQAKRDSAPEDGLPSAIEVQLKIVDPEKEGKFYTYNYLIGISSAEEKWIKQTDDDEKPKPPTYFTDEE